MKLGYSLSKPSQARSSAPVSRKDFTDRLGLPEAASNAEVLDTLNAKLADHAKPSLSAEDEALYRTAFQ